MKDALRIFRFLLDEARRGNRVALLTLTHVEGSSARAIGSHLAVSATGAYVGSFSGGCVESAIVGEARRVLEKGCPEILRFGAGSPFIDIRLPCGGGIDILIQPDPALPVLSWIVADLEARKRVSLRLNPVSGLEPVECSVVHPPGWTAGHFLVQHDPALRIIVAGHGEEPVALARLATAYGAEVIALTPDEATLKAVNMLGVDTILLKSVSSVPDLPCDDRTAIILLFHDHDWEEGLLIAALRHPCFYIGAMGSRATHESRLRMLESRGVPVSEQARVKGPIGLIPASRDADTLALSVLAEIIACDRPSRESGKTQDEESVGVEPWQKRMIVGRAIPRLSLAT